MKPCKHTDKIDGCRVCWLFANDLRYRKLWADKTAVPSSSCVHFGNPTGKTVRCLTCAGAQLKTFECGIHGECTIAKQGVGVTGCCEGCPDKRTSSKVLPPANGWACGVTTVYSRKDTTLPKSLDTLANGGFGGLRLFVDGIDNAQAIEWQKQFSMPVIAHDPALKTVGNWIVALWELYIRNPKCSKFAIFQDDILMCRDVRQYIDANPWPDRGYLNLYTFPVNQAHAGDKLGWFDAKECNNGPLYHGRKGQKGLGALGLCFTRACVIDLLSSRHLVERPIDAMYPTNKLDGCIVTALNKAGWREHCHNPSLVQHTGDKSSMMHNPHPKAPSFRGEQWSALAHSSLPIRTS